MEGDGRGDEMRTTGGTEDGDERSCRSRKYVGSRVQRWKYVCEAPSVAIVLACHAERSLVCRFLSPILIFHFEYAFVCDKLPYRKSLVGLDCTTTNDDIEKESEG
jgi:hypothetical protein